MLKLKEIERREQAAWQALVDAALDFDGSDNVSSTTSRIAQETRQRYQQFTKELHRAKKTSLDEMGI